MASLHKYRTASGARWRVRWFGETEDGTRVQRSVTFTDTPDDYLDARKLAEELTRLEKRDQPAYELDAFVEKFRTEMRARRAKPMTVLEAVDAVLSEKEALVAAGQYKASSYKHLTELRATLKRLYPDTLLADLTREGVERDFRGYMNAHAKKPKPALSHANKSLGLLKRSMRRARQGGQRFDDAILDVQPNRVTPRQRRALSWQQVEEIAGSSTEPHLIRFLALTGLRIGEAFNLTDADIEGDYDSVVVRDAKTQAGLRRVMLPKRAQQDLRLQLMRRKGVRWVFPGARGERWIENNFRARVFGPAVEAAGLADVKPHDLRATNATFRMEAGSPKHEVCDQMGWSPKAYESMLAIYMKAREEHRVSAADRLDVLFGEASA